MTSMLIAYAYTGGGHRAAALAIRGALESQHSGASVTLVDPFATASRWPFTALSRAYPRVVERMPWLWGAGFALTNTPGRTRAVQRAAWPALRNGFSRLAAEHAPSVIVSTHPLLTAPLRRVFPRTPIIAVVTDLVTGHVSWYEPTADIIVVPTPAAREHAIGAGIEPARILTIGVPVGAAFVAQPGERTTLAAHLGWSTERPTILLAGGGEGMGPLEALTVAIDRAVLPCDVAVVTGRNSALAARLRARRWQGTVHIYDFVPNFAQLLRAASVLVTKAGPGTISEACASGCPLVLSGAIPGQEAGNVHYVTKAFQ